MNKGVDTRAKEYALANYTNNFVRSDY